MINPALSQAERIRMGLTPDPSIVPPPPEPEAPGVVCTDDQGRACNDRKCRRCNGTKRVRFIMWRGRYRTRVEIAQRILKSPEWRGCMVKTLGTCLYLGKGKSIMKLEHFTPEELQLFKPENMMATKKTKTDGRAKNGAEDRGLIEDSQLVRGPAELIGAMRELATKNGQTVSHVWREAAQQYLKAHA